MCTLSTDPFQTVFDRGDIDDFVAYLERLHHPEKRFDCWINQIKTKINSQHPTHGLWQDMYKDLFDHHVPSIGTYNRFLPIISAQQCHLCFDLAVVLHCGTLVYGLAPFMFFLAVHLMACRKFATKVAGDYIRKKIGDASSDQLRSSDAPKTCPLRLFFYSLNSVSSLMTL